MCDPSPEGDELVGGLQASGRYRIDVLLQVSDALHVAANAALRPPLAVICALSPGATDAGPNGLDVMGAFARTCPETALIAHVNPRGDRTLVRVAWAALQPLSVLDATAPLATRLRAVHGITHTGQRQVDPALEAVLPDVPITAHQPDLDDLVAHRGHAALWRSLLDSPKPPCPLTLARRSRLAPGAIERYLGDVADTLAGHGLADPSLEDLYQFARTNRARLDPLIESRMTCGVPTTPR